MVPVEYEGRPEPLFVDARLIGFYRPDFIPGGRQLLSAEPIRPGTLPSEGWTGTIRLQDRRITRIHNARALQRAGTQADEFFREYGFVLLNHESKVRDWASDLRTQSVSPDIADTYYAEVEELIRSRLLPDRDLEIWHTGLGLVPGESSLRRGPGSRNGYVPFVHADYGLTAEDYQDTAQLRSTELAARNWRLEYDREHVNGFMVIDFWRPVNMQLPVRFLPLAVCDPRSVDTDDIVHSGLLNATASGETNNIMQLRFNDGQRWYYYPKMTGSEVLAFTAFRCTKGDIGTELRACFHTAFEEPGVPDNVEVRQSFEHRVGVFILNS